MKNHKLLHLICIIFIAVFSASCATISNTILTKDARVIHNAYITKIENDSIHYSTADTIIRISEIDNLVEDPSSPIHINQTIAGLSYSYSLLPYYTELPRLPKDTVVNTSGSVLIPRGHKAKTEYVLSLGPDEQYMLRKSDLMSFYKRHSPEAYKLHKSGLAFAISGGVGFAGGYAMLLYGAITLKDQIPVYAENSNPFYPNKPLYYNEVTNPVSAVILAAGVVVAISSYSMLIVGIKRRFQSYELYNIQAAKPQPEITLSPCVTGDGIGLALQF